MSNAVDLVMVGGPASGRAVCVEVPKMTNFYEFIVEGKASFGTKPASERSAMSGIASRIPRVTPSQPMRKSWRTASTRTGC